MDKELYYKIKEMTKKDYKSLVERCLKLTEEIGELSEAILSFMKVRGCEYKGKTENDIIEESIDCIVIVYSILSMVDDGLVDFDHIIEDKLTKWESKLGDTHEK